MVILKFLLGYILFMFMMIFDNLLWISGSPEYYAYKKYPFKQKIDYIIKQRIIPVLTAWRDIIPAVTTGLIFTLI